MRGIGSNSLSIGAEQSIAVIVDGVYYGQGRTINEGFFDLGGIEILKGPQSLFYGKNATAGVISIATANPTDHFTSLLRAGYEFNAQKVYGETVLSGPLGDRLGFRIGVRASKDFGSLFDNRAGPITYNTRDTPTRTTVATNTPHIAPASSDDGPNERELLTRATLRWEATDRLTATLKANYSVNKTMPGTWNYAVFACEGGFSTTTPGVACTRDFAGRVNNLPPEIAAVTSFAHADGENLILIIRGERPPRSTIRSTISRSRRSPITIGTRTAGRTTSITNRRRQSTFGAPRTAATTLSRPSFAY